MNLKQSLTEVFQKQFGVGGPVICVRSPGRIEILGNHTDYNNGFALAGAISRDVYVLLRPRSDRLIRCFSKAYPARGIVSFSLDDLPQAPAGDWVDYVRGVCVELIAQGFAIGGADIFVQSDLPNSGGISSSAALELGVALGLVQLFELSVNKPHVDMQALARLCQSAENNFVGTPCGFLDQAAVALPKAEHMLFIDFLQNDDKSYPTQLIPAALDANQLAFVLAVDPSVKRNLGETGYPARRKQCEQSLLFWSEALGRKVSSLREVSVSTFEAHEQNLRAHDALMHKRVKHVIYENQRVLTAVQALKENDFETFGRILTASGESALNLYDLAEGVPQLRDLVTFASGVSGVLGARNMGGGFSVLALALVEKSAIDGFTTQVRAHYQDLHPEGELTFIEVALRDGAGLLWQ